MRLPDRAIHVVLFVAALATVATSAPEEDPPDGDSPGDGAPGRLHELSASDQSIVPGFSTRHLLVSINGPAAQQAEEIWIEFAWPEGVVNDVMTVIPDTAGLEPQRITREPIDYDATSICAGLESCFLGFTIGQANEGSGPVIVTANLVSSAPFSGAAAVQVAFDSNE